MPIIYLSPSTQESNYYVNGGTEEQHMNRLADEMIPYLDASGIRYVRNTPQMTAASSIRASNAGNYDAHFALHSNASAPSNYGQQRGSIAFYYPNSTEGRRLADSIVGRLQGLYPMPQQVRAATTTSIGEVTRVRAPSVLLELAFHDNQEDAEWIINNTATIAPTLVQALTDYFNIPFLSPTPSQTGVVTTSEGNVNIRARPSLDAPVINQAPKDAHISILNQWQNWYLVNYNGTIGYASSDFITLT